MKLVKVIVLAFVALAFLLLPLAVFSQVPTPEVPPAPPVPSEFDAKATAFITKYFTYWQTLLVPITLVLTTCIKKWVKFIPDNWLPFCAPVIGGLLDLAATKFGLWTGNGAVGATMGMCATWFHQAYNQQTESPPGDPPADEPGQPS